MKFESSKEVCSLKSYPLQRVLLRESREENEEAIKKAKSASEKDEALKKLIQQDWKLPEKFLNDNFKNIRSIILKSIGSHGYENNGNKFISYILKNGDVIDPNHESKIELLRNLINYKIIDYDDEQDWFSKESLYSRDDDEFEYAVKIFNIVAHKNLVKQYFKKSLFKDENGKTIKIETKGLYSDPNTIKPSGLTNHEEGSIWDQVEMWADKLGEVEKKKAEKKCLNYALMAVRLQMISLCNFKQTC